MAGFTTVRDLGTSNGLARSLRRAINEGWVVGPRLFTAGKALATSGGHGDPSNGVNQRLAEDPGPAQGVVNSIADAYKAVRIRYKEQSDLIKITATGGVLSQASSGQNPQFTVEEVEAVIAAARDYGFKVAAQLGPEYTDALVANAEVIGKNVTENIYERHMVPLFVG